MKPIRKHPWSKLHVLVKELKDAGWVRMNLTTWRAPCGCQYRGPANAHRVMKLLDARNCPNRHD